MASAGKLGNASLWGSGAETPVGSRGKPLVSGLCGET